jgi:hypothetical protein
MLVPQGEHLVGDLVGDRYTANNIRDGIRNKTFSALVI